MLSHWQPSPVGQRTELLLDTKKVFLSERILSGVGLTGWTVPCPPFFVSLSLPPARGLGRFLSERQPNPGWCQSTKTLAQPSLAA